MRTKSSSAAPPSSVQDGAERRTQPRFAGAALVAQVRCKGQLGRQSVEVLDFSRHGVAVRLSRPLPKDQLVYVTLDDGVAPLRRVIGVVHNCVSQKAGYRCGIRFRTQSGQQFDRFMVEAALISMERRLAGDADTSGESAGG